MIKKNSKYEGLSIEDCIDLYYKNSQRFKVEDRCPFCEAVSSRIVKRVKEIDGRSRKELEREEPMWSASLGRVYIRHIYQTADGRSEPHFYNFIDIHAEGPYDIGLSRCVNPEEDVDDIEYVFIKNDPDELISLYRALQQIGFFNEELTDEFEL